MKKISTANGIAENLFLMLFFLLPISDAINGFMIRTRGIYGIGSSYHLFLIVILFFIAYGHRRIRVRFYECITLVLVIAAILTILVNSALHQVENISVERIEKIVCTFISIAALMRMVNCKIVSRKTMIKAIRMQCLIVPTITLFADIMNIANYTYQTAKVGKIGFYTGSNEPVAVLIILGGILLIELSTRFNLEKLFCFFEVEICLIFVQSKLGYLMMSILAVSSVALLLKKFLKNSKVKPKHLLVGVVALFGGICIGRRVLTKTLGAFLQRQAYQKSYLGKYGFLGYISSGRTTRFKALLAPIMKGNSVIVLFKIFLGQGARFGYSEIFEMDYFDAFLYGGLVMTVCFLLVTVKALKDSKAINRICFETVLLVFVYAFVGGHVWTGGVAGIYLALLLSYCAMEKLSREDILKNQRLKASNNIYINKEGIGESPNHYFKRHTK